MWDLVPRVMARLGDESIDEDFPALRNGLHFPCSSDGGWDAQRASVSDSGGGVVKRKSPRPFVQGEDNSRV